MIRVSNLNFSYGNKPILNDINLDIEPSTIVSLVGPNGSGKSTFLKCLSRILRSDESAIEIDGRPLHQYSRKELARMLAYVPQSPALNLAITVIDAIKIGRAPHIGYWLKQCDEDIVFDAIEQFGLDKYAFTPMHELSGGEKQRVLLARVVAQRARILLLDEPTSALDLRNQLETASLLRSVQKQQDLTVIVAIHDLNLASRFSDSVVQLKQGSRYAHGRWAETMTTESIREIYGVEAHLDEVKNVPFVVSLKAVPQSNDPQPDKGRGSSKT
ncbi:MAG: ABC transporter ATP-binding protein [Paracoccaceae bacterium]